jgi:cytochrome d ubiquinol oxidase subunit II
VDELAHRTSSPGILDWYTVTGGLLALVVLALHGSSYLAMKTEEDMGKRPRNIVLKTWPRC